MATSHPKRSAAGAESMWQWITGQEALETIPHQVWLAAPPPARQHPAPPPLPLAKVGQHVLQRNGGHQALQERLQEFVVSKGVAQVGW